MFTMNIPKKLIEALQSGNLVLFVGSGLSLRVFEQHGKKYPTWAELLYLLNNWCEENDAIDNSEHKMIEDIIKRNNYSVAAQLLKKRINNTDFGSFLYSVFNIGNQYDIIHKTILSLPFAYYITTNYDSVIETAYSDLFAKKIPALTSSEIGLANKFMNDNELFLFKIHGTFERGNTVVLSDYDYHTLYNQDSFVKTLNKIFLSKTVLFVGFGYNDVAIRNILTKLTFSFNGNNGIHYLLAENNAYNNMEKEYYKDTDRVYIIEYDNSDGTHSGINQFFEQLLSDVKKNDK